jgi:hypothetical protein
VKLSEFDRIGKGARTRYVTQVADAATQEAFELTIAGPAALVKRMFGDAELDLTIDSGRTQDHVVADFGTDQADHRKAVWELAGLEDTRALLKAAPAPADAKTTVFASARPVKGHGTPFAFVLSRFFVPAGASLFFFGSFVFSAVGSLRPTTGDQDLFLRLFSATGAPVSSSILGGTAIDFVWFTFPLFPFPFVPVFEVKGFTAGTCGVFAAQGA